ncbi:MAG: hypothetical protein K6F99_10790 [Lachnospiraceae bacterium]|nr:hypothetical protein [Lachnospiraceae bacterium]
MCLKISRKLKNTIVVTILSLAAGTGLVAGCADVTSSVEEEVKPEVIKSEIILDEGDTVPAAANVTIAAGAEVPVESGIDVDMVKNNSYKAASEINTTLTAQDKTSKTYALIYFDKATVTGEEIARYGSIMTEKVAERAANFADLYTPSKMMDEALSRFSELNDLDKTVVACFYNMGWITDEELSSAGISSDEFLDYVVLDMVHSDSISNDEASNVPIEVNAMRSTAPTDKSIANSVFSSDRVTNEDVYIYTGNEINENSNSVFVSSLMSYVNDYTKADLYNYAHNSWASLNTESKRALVYTLKLGWLEKGSLVQGQVSIEEVDRMLNLSFG